MSLTMHTLLKRVADGTFTMPSALSCDAYCLQQSLSMSTVDVMQLLHELLAQSFMKLYGWLVH